MLNRHFVWKHNLMKGEKYGTRAILYTKRNWWVTWSDSVKTLYGNLTFHLPNSCNDKANFWTTGSKFDESKKTLQQNCFAFNFSINENTTFLFPFPYFLIKTQCPVQRPDWPDCCRWCHCPPTTAGCPLPRPRGQAPSACRGCRAPRARPCGACASSFSSSLSYAFFSLSLLKIIIG